MGKSGAGKSTLVGVLGGLLQPTTGCVLVGGEVVVAARENDTQVRIVCAVSLDCFLCYGAAGSFECV